jgi:hypothetical protein
VQVLLCEETVSLLGIRQFYKLVRDTATDSSSSGTSNGASSSTADAAAAAATDVPAPAAQQPQLHQNEVKAGPAGEKEQQPQLSIAEQQQLLVLKVEVLLQLLSSVSFHQVWVPAQTQQFAHAVLSAAA